MEKFKLSENFINKYKRKKAPFGFNGLGELVYMRTYSRIKESTRTSESDAILKDRSSKLKQDDVRVNTNVRYSRLIIEVNGYYYRLIISEVL